MTTQMIIKINSKNYEIEELNKLLKSHLTKIGLSIFHINIHCLNANNDSLCEALKLIETNFDIICLSEIWATNIEAYKNLMPNFNFIFKLPINGKIGGVGIYIYPNKLVTQY